MTEPQEITCWTPWSGLHAKAEVLPAEGRAVFVKLRLGKMIGPSRPDRLAWAHVGSSADIVGFAYPEYHP